MYVTAPTGESEAELGALLFDKVARRNRTGPYEEKKYRGAGIEEVRAWWKSCRNWMESYRTYGEPFVFDFKKLLKALSNKDTAAQLEVDNFMENCAKRWQTKDGTYRLKRLGILVQTMIWETSKHGQLGAILLGGRELVRVLRGTRTFHLLHFFCKFPSLPGLVLWALLCCVFVSCLLLLSGKFVFCLHSFQLLTDNVSH